MLRLPHLSLSANSGHTASNAFAPFFYLPSDIGRWQTSAYQALVPFAWLLSVLLPVVHVYRVCNVH
jgi:hypothetical protein